MHMVQSDSGEAIGHHVAVTASFVAVHVSDVVTDYLSAKGSQTLPHKLHQPLSTVNSEMPDKIA